MKTRYYFIILAAIITASCNFLDIIPDNIATLDMAFNTRTNAEKYLATCYNFVPSAASVSQNTGMICGGELWYLKPQSTTNRWNNYNSFSIARGLQNANDPCCNIWSGSTGVTSMFRGIHECNIFLDHIGNVPDMDEWEKEKWAAEVKVLKAYYNYWLMLHYGPIPLLKENAAVDTDLEDMMLERESIDAVTEYITGLLDDAMKGESLPVNVTSDQTELGRITLPIAAAIKAKVLILAASPLFNGNEQMKSLVNAKGECLIPQVESKEKWVKAAEACKQAIELAHLAGCKLYDFDVRLNYDEVPEVHEELTLRGTISERWNSEIVWALGSNDTAALQNLISPHLSSYSIGNNYTQCMSQLSPTLDVVERFYSENGVPIEEDLTYDYEGRYNLTTTPDDKYRFASDYTTIKLHLNREPRFYAYIGFDGGRWLDSETATETDDAIYEFFTKKGDLPGVSDELYSVTGYFPKKLCSWRNIHTSASRVRYAYSFPIIRLSDLYLLYAEALNQIKDAPDDEVYEYIQKVRDKDGLDKETGSLVATWAKYSKDPLKPTKKEGMAQIIQRERLIEFLFEGQTYHDIRRWKLGAEYLSTPVTGWSVLESKPAFFYEKRTIATRTFMPRDYLWPIKNSDLYKNDKLVQNPLW